MIAGKINLIIADKNENEFIERYGEKIKLILKYDNMKFDGQITNELFESEYSELRGITKGDVFVISSCKSYFKIVDDLRNVGCDNYFSIPEYEAMLLYEQREKNNIFLLLTPDYGNIGDQAIALAEEVMISRLMPDHKLIEIDLGLFRRVQTWLDRIIFKEDKIYITGGGFLGSLWMDGGEKKVREILQAFPDNEIVVFPQSLFFGHDENGEKEKERSISIYNHHNKLKIIFREVYSYQLAEKLLQNKDNIFLLPDIVLSMFTERSTPYSRNMSRRAGIALKTDKESLLSEKEKTVIQETLKKCEYEVVSFSTQKRKRITPHFREDEIKEKLDEIREYGLVITDCLHGMIFCALVGTPCVAFDQISHKVRGEYKWICDLPYICFMDDVSCLNEEVIKRIIDADNDKRFSYLPYEKKLKRILDKTI